MHFFFPRDKREKRKREQRGKRNVEGERGRKEKERKLIRDFPKPRGPEIGNVRLVNPAVATNFLIPFSSRINRSLARDPSKSPPSRSPQSAGFLFVRPRSISRMCVSASHKSLMKDRANDGRFYHSVTSLLYVLSR